MNPLQYFDEEYSSFEKSLNSIQSILLQSHDIYFKIQTIQKRMRTVDKNNKLSVEEVSQFLDDLSVLSSLSSEILSSVQKIKSSIVFRSELDGF